MRLLVIEDDVGIRGPLVRFLQEEGFAVDAAVSKQTGESMLNTYPYDALICDVRLPEGGSAGFELVRDLRDRGVHTPVLFLSARDGLQDRLEGLDSGGDDYLVKPFHLSEVRSRVRALLRRSTPTRSTVLTWDNVTMDWSTRRVLSDGHDVHLTGKELGLLELLSTHPGRLFTREEIIERVWDAEFDAETNVVDVYVRNLRRKLGDAIIETVRGVGYRFASS
ncbi:MAG: response regulator transcription factor [Deinococcaceae bacterium]